METPGRTTFGEILKFIKGTFRKASSGGSDTPDRKNFLKALEGASSIEITVDVYRGSKKTDTTKIFFVRGSKQEDDWDMVLPTENVRLPPGTSRASVQEELEAILKELEAYCDRVRPGMSWAEILQYANQMLGSGGFPDLYYELHIYGYSGQSHQPSLAPLVLAAAYCLHAQGAVRGDDLRAAHSALMEARMWSSDGYLLENPHKKNQERARTGGVGKRDIYYTPVRKRAVELLESMKPAGGWESRAQAIRVIVDDLAKYIEEKKESLPGSEGSLSFDNLENTLKSWMASYEDVRGAYEANARKRIETST